jgi:hypothetical protein
VSKTKIEQIKKAESQNGSAFFTLQIYLTQKAGLILIKVKLTTND